MSLELLFFPLNSDRRIGVWPHYGSICKCQRSGRLSGPVSDTFTRGGGKKKRWQRAIQPAVSKDTLHRTRVAIQRQIIYSCVRPRLSLWRSADRICEGAPSRINTGHSHGPPVLHLPSSTLRPPTPECGALRLRPSREGEPTVAHLPHSTSKDGEHPCTPATCTAHHRAPRHVL